ncbi:MAG: oligosaccharide flippase family protein [Candidatus Omnitrophota bacterium]
MNVHTTSRKKEIMRQSGIYSASTLLTQLITFIAAFLTRRFLGPTQMGIWSTLQILVDYSKYAAMGTMTAVAIEIPYWAGKGELDRAEKIKNTAFTFLTVSSLLICIAIAIFALLTQGKFPAEVTFGLFFVSAIIFLQRMSNLLITLLRCYKKFHVESGQMVWSSIVNAALIALLASRFKMYGFIWALGLSFVFNIIYLLRKHRYHFRWYFDRQTFQPLLIRGFPLMLLGLLNTGFQNIDRMVIAKMLGFELLGFYSIALMTCSFISNFSNAANTVLVPHFQEKLGEKDDPDDLQEFLFKASLPLALIMPIVISCAWLFVPLLIKIFLPKFIPGIAAMKLLVLSSFFTASLQPYQTFLLTVKKHWLIFPILGFVILLATGSSWLAVHFRKGIDGVAIAVTFASFTNFALSYFVATKMFSNQVRLIKRFLIILSCFAYLIFFLFLETRCALLSKEGLVLFAIESFSTMAFCVPLLWILNRRFFFFRRPFGGGDAAHG